MKTIRSLMILAGLSLAVLALGVTGAKAQILTTSTFSGSFTLPVAAQWGQMTLPAGTYTLRYGYVADGSVEMVEIAGKAKGSPHGGVLASGYDLTSARKSSLVCVREGDTLVVRRLEMGTIGESVSFTLPHGAQLTAKLRNGSAKTLLAEAPMMIERVPVTMKAK